MPRKAPYKIPDEECERLRRPEMAACRTIMTLASDLHYAQDDLADRLDCIPYGKARLNMIVGGIDSLFTDLVGTISDKQRLQLLRQAQDLVMKAVPKMDMNNNKVMVYLDDIKELVECARAQCRQCADTGEEARKCRLYKWLEANIPLDDYGDDLICPYAREEWE